MKSERSDFYYHLKIVGSSRPSLIEFHYNRIYSIFGSGRRVTKIDGFVDFLWLWWVCLRGMLQLSSPEYQHQRCGCTKSLFIDVNWWFCRLFVVVLGLLARDVTTFITRVSTSTMRMHKIAFYRCDQNLTSIWHVGHLKYSSRVHTIWMEIA